MSKYYVVSVLLALSFCCTCLLSYASDTDPVEEMPIAVKWTSQCIKMGGVTKGLSNGVEEIEFRISYACMTSEGLKWYYGSAYVVYDQCPFHYLYLFEIPIYNENGQRAYNPDGTAITCGILSGIGSELIRFVVYSHALVGSYWLYGSYYETDISASWHIGNYEHWEAP